MFKRTTAAAFLAVTFALPASADDIVKAAADLCETFKGCAIEQMGAMEMTPEMRQMMEPMFASMCTGIGARIGEVPTGHKLHQPAVACLRSLEKLGCAAMNNDGDDANTPECEKYEELAEQYGVDQP